MNQTFYVNPDTLATMTELTIKGSTEYVTDADQCFSRQKVLKTINGTFDFSGLTGTGTYRTFYGCSALEDFRIASGSLARNMTIADSPNLSLETLASIVSGLADLTGQTGRTITLHATAKAKLTAEQTAAITAKNWTLAQRSKIMTRETFTQIILIADEGMWLVNETVRTFSQKVYLGKSADEHEWREIDEAEKERLEEEWGEDNAD